MPNALYIFLSSHDSAKQVEDKHELISKWISQGYVLKVFNTVADVNGGAVTFLLYSLPRKVAISET